MTFKAWNGYALDSSGNVMDAATVTVVLASDGITKPQLYSDKTGTTKTNPFMTDATGKASFYIGEGLYKVTAVKDAETSTFDDVVINFESDELIPTVPDLGSLPSAATFSGKLRYVDDVGVFKSDGTDWNRQYGEGVTPTVATLAELQALGALSEGIKRNVIERTSGKKGGGLFIARTGDKSTQVAGDEVNVGLGNGGRWVAFGSDLTGASGAWERLEDNYSVPIDTLWYGISTDTTSYATNPTLYDEIRTQNARVMQVVTDQVGFSNRRDIGMPSGAVNSNAWEIRSKRNVKYVGQGGSGVQNGSRISLADDVGTPYNDAGDNCQLLITSSYYPEFNNISIVSIVTPAGANARQIVINALDSPEFSTHFPKFVKCAISASAGVTFLVPPILVYGTKLGRFDQTIITYPNNDAALQLGIDDDDAPSALLKGACENFSIKGGFLFGDIITQNVRGLLIDEETQFDKLPSGNGAARVISAGDEKASGVNIYATFLGVDDRSAAIVQASRTNSAQLLASGGWRVKSIFRDRLIGVDVKTGYIDLDGSIFQTRAANTGTEIGVRIAEGAEQVSIGATTDFSVLHANNHIAVQDNRAEFHLLNTTGSTGAFPIGETVTGGTSGSTATVRGYNTTTNTVKTTIPSADFTVGELLTATPSGKTATLTFEFLSNERDGLVMSCELVKDYTLISTGSYETIITRRLASKLTGGVYNFNGSLSIRSNLASRYRMKVLVNGSDIGVAKALTMPIAEDGVISFSKDVVLPSDTTTPSTITLQIQQETAGTAAVIRGDTTLGDSWLQVRRL